MLGAGTIKPGEMLMIGGTSVVQLFQLDVQRPMQGFWGPYPHALVDDHWLVEAGQVSAGSVLTWFEKNLFELDADGRAALRERAAAIPVGGTGLLTLDYFMGNRTPYREPLLRGPSSVCHWDTIVPACTDRQSKGWRWRPPTC
ncbi:FGGY-family carbohydrate kinase (plasmid) [Rhizobium sp. 32-5/1]|uniref:FGGY-family carbohydrate kinase n=1 Tax=Rhizobium sp. 32-5/1 TaxID=3019602 RepID=UPI00240E2D2A|nr:FGGY-family carbohydrate kinase [Rhizobium sp. 32-5/1]WEZ86029.1 FGGY-family carbohydrate kinase [Rhizobium sp. 32-5/1]